MQAKDTVMTHKQRVECSHNPNLELRERDMCHAQAEISFKAGIREVVEWLGRAGYCPVFLNVNIFSVESVKLQAKLKEWGITH